MPLLTTMVGLFASGLFLIRLLPQPARLWPTGVSALAVLNDTSATPP